jgi:hypothetical protein
MSDLAEMTQRIRDIEHWKNGDGAVGAERRLQLVEEKSQAIEQNCCADLCSQNADEVEDLRNRMIDVEHVQEDLVTTQAATDLVEQAKDGFIKALRAERKRATEIFKALAPYFVALCGALVAIFMR